MYREKLVRTPVKTVNATRLKQLLLDYHQFRYQPYDQLAEERAQLSLWQSERLKSTHQDLYTSPRYHEALDFLLEDLYAPKSFTQRDDDLDRIFPMMVKLLPDSLLYTLAELIELNLLTQTLDLELAKMHFEQMATHTISTESYAEAYRRCNNKHERLHQIQLIANIGNDLDTFVRSRMLRITLKMTRSAAEMAGLGALHQFLSRGFEAFYEMGGVDDLLDKIIERETVILNQIYSNMANPLGMHRESFDILSTIQ